MKMLPGLGSWWSESEGGSWDGVGGDKLLRFKDVVFKRDFAVD